MSQNSILNSVLAVSITALITAPPCITATNAKSWYSGCSAGSRWSRRIVDRNSLPLADRYSLGAVAPAHRIESRPSMGVGQRLSDRGRGIKDVVGRAQHVPGLGHGDRVGDRNIARDRPGLGAVEKRIRLRVGQADEAVVVMLCAVLPTPRPRSTRRDAAGVSMMTAGVEGISIVERVVLGDGQVRGPRTRRCPCRRRDRGRVIDLGMFDSIVPAASSTV